MKSAYVIRHLHFEDLGVLAEVLVSHGYQAAYHEAPAERLDAAAMQAADLLVILGGPIGVYEEDIYPFLGEEIAATARRLQAGRPVLGICLGAQIIARALGARVYPSGVVEIGWAPLTLTAAGRDSVLAPLAGRAVLHWHGDTFDLPAGADLLASTAVVPHQAFRLGSTALALQFHLEACQLEPWFVGHAGEIARTPGLDVPGLRRQTAEAVPALAAAARQVFGDWLTQLEPGTDGA